MTFSPLMTMEDGIQQIQDPIIKKVLREISEIKAGIQKILSIMAEIEEGSDNEDSQQEYDYSR